MENTNLTQSTSAENSHPPKNAPELKIPKPRKKRRWLKWLIILAVIAAVVIFIGTRVSRATKQFTNSLYLQDTVARRDMTVTVSGTATVRPTDSYRVTALVTGEVLSAPLRRARP
jgi:HlyD family secretion protein